MRLFAEPKLGSMAIGEAAGLIDLGSARTDIGGCFRIGSTERAGLGRGTEILAVRRIAAVLLAFMLPLTGCSEPASDALQAAGDAESDVCGPSLHDRRHTVGLQWFVNKGPLPVRVTGVRWLNLVGLTDVDIRVVGPVKVGDRGGIGIVGGSPPEGRPSDREVRLWPESRPLEPGAELPLAEMDNPLQVLIGFAGTTGSAGPLEISFTDGAGRSGIVRGHLTKVEVAKVC